MQSEARFGFMKHQITMATKLRLAANPKNTLAFPVSLFNRSGNKMALRAAPMLPTMFIEPETAPELAPPISLQKAQLGLSVMSTPNVAKAEDEPVELCIAGRKEIQVLGLHRKNQTYAPQREADNRRDAP